jgi:hypothetical protein
MSRRREQRTFVGAVEPEGRLHATSMVYGFFSPACTLTASIQGTIPNEHNAGPILHVRRTTYPVPLSHRITTIRVVALQSPDRITHV